MHRLVPNIHSSFESEYVKHSDFFAEIVQHAAHSYHDDFEQRSPIIF